MTTSVVIPAYNEEKLIGRTLDSISQLDRKPDEVIVVNGGSTDKTAEIAANHKAKVLTIAHRGIGFARQMGLEFATGDIIAYTDADTLVPHDWLDKIVQSLSTSGISGVYGGYKVDGGWFVYRWFINYINPILFPLMHILGKPIPGGQNIAFWRKKGIEAGGFPIDFKSVEDYEMARRLKRVGKLVYHPNNYVLSSGRRGKEGLPMIWRVLKGIGRYFITGKADTFDFPDIR